MNLEDPKYNNFERGREPLTEEDITHFVREVKKTMKDARLPLGAAINAVVGGEPDLSNFERENLTSRLKNHFKGELDQIPFDLTA